jgi:hypothetical protein
MNVTKNGIIITIPDAEIVRMALERIGETKPIELARIVAPQIGQVWEGQGGVYAGIARGRDGAPDYHLIVGPEFDGELAHEHATKWAAGLQLHCFSDYALPFRKEQALSFANVPELFKQEYYWSREQHASRSGFAWGQYFNDGYQDHWTKDSHVRARAVRRLTIQ